MTECFLIIIDKLLITYVTMTHSGKHRNKWYATKMCLLSIYNFTHPQGLIKKILGQPFSLNLAFCAYNYEYTLEEKSKVRLIVWAKELNSYLVKCKGGYIYACSKHRKLAFLATFRPNSIFFFSNIVQTF